MLDLDIELDAAQKTRLLALERVRALCIGEDVPVGDLLAMAAWLVDGDMEPAHQIAELTNRLYGQTEDAVRYKRDEEYKPTDLRHGPR